MSLLSLTSRIESSDEFHLSRLLILIDTFGGTRGEDAIEGITKLAKLDFLLRYPSYLAAALRARHTNPAAADVHEFEIGSVESSMIRFKYGPWDFRYRRFLNLLSSKGLAHIFVSGRTVHVGITKKGRTVAEELKNAPEFSDLTSRARLLKTHLDLSATGLMKFIYETFPEIGTLRYGEHINEFQNS
jgi:hypothetical protein